MHYVTKLLHLHEMIDFDGLRLANSVHVVPSQVHKHDVLRTIFFRSKQHSAQLFIVCVIKMRCDAIRADDKRADLPESFLSWSSPQ